VRGPLGISVTEAGHKRAVYEGLAYWKTQPLENPAAEFVMYGVKVGPAL
jgi:hypothetical protein